MPAPKSEKDKECGKRKMAMEMEIKTIFIVCLIRLEIRLVVVITSELYGWRNVGEG